jgi:undecaprenyl-diphosphatase
LTGSLIAAVSGYFCIKYLLIFLSKHKLNIFAYYCWILGLFMFFFFSKIN